MITTSSMNDRKIMEMILNEAIEVIQRMKEALDTDCIELDQCFALSRLLSAISKHLEVALDDLFMKIPDELSKMRIMISKFVSKKTLLNSGKSLEKACIKTITSSNIPEYLIPIMSEILEIPESLLRRTYDCKSFSAKLKDLTDLYLNYDQISALKKENSEQSLVKSKITLDNCALLSEVSQ